MKSNRQAICGREGRQEMPPPRLPARRGGGEESATYAAAAAGPGDLSTVL